MKTKIFLVCLMSSISISICGCAGRFRGPSGDSYYVHSSRHVSLFKIKSPDAAWYVNKNFTAGRNEAIFFDNALPKSYNKTRVGGQLTADFEYGRFLQDSSYFFEKFDILMNINSAARLTALKSSGREKIEFKGVSCFLLNYDSASEDIREVVTDRNSDKIEVTILKPAKISRIIECPGFFNKTFGVLQISMEITADTLEHAKMAFKEKEQSFNRSLSSFKFLARFSQEIPPGFSVENQLKKVGGRWYSL